MPLIPNYWFGCFCPSLSHLGLSCFFYFFRKTHENTPHPHRISRTHITVRIKLSNWWFFGVLPGHPQVTFTSGLRGIFTGRGILWWRTAGDKSHLRTVWIFARGLWWSRTYPRVCLNHIWWCIIIFLFINISMCLVSLSYIDIYTHRLRILYEHL